MRFRTLAEWLGWQEQLHPAAIDLGLDRVADVVSRLVAGPIAPIVITVGGTNGKGSTVALLESMFTAGGYRVGRYTSPHLLRYNERIGVAGEDADDTALCEAFARVDEARGKTSLTYFEFGTLAALDLFSRGRLDVALLEVGMGGRLDATNAVDADVAVVTTVDMDHTQWLGPDREAIGREKAGIFRAGRPAVYGDSQPPTSLLEHAGAIGSALYRLGRDFGWEAAGPERGPGGLWWGPHGRRRDALPWPALRASVQWKNAATALMVVELLADRLPLTQSQVRAGLHAVRLGGRFEVLPGPVTRIFDVAHNPQAAAVLAQTLHAMPCAGRTHAVFGMLADKDARGVAQAMVPLIDAWHVGSLKVERGAQAAQLATSLAQSGAGAIVYHDGIADAYRAALRMAQEGDRVVVFGSFYSVAEALSEPV